MLASLIAVVSLVISLFTFSLQFIAHDKLSLLVSQVTTSVITAQKPENLYFTVSLSAFNTGNRPVTLISVSADILEMSFPSEQQTVTDADCRSKQWRRLHLAQPGSGKPVSGSLLYEYSAVIDAAKPLTAILVFSRFADETIGLNERVEGVVCLRLSLADARGKIYRLSHALEGVSVAFPDVSTLRRIRRADPASVPTTVVDDQRLELPF